jgi:hypothetical protein
MNDSKFTVAMTITERVVLALVIIAVDLVLFVLPLTGLAAAYVIVARPPWFREWVERLYLEQPGS